MTKIIAHRGAKAAAPQNTIPAFQLAKDMGADGFENDVHYTKDGHIVVCHDYSINETSNGSGMILEMTLEELYKYDFGSYFSKEFEGTKIPTLKEFFEVAKGLPVINVEIKRPLTKDYNIANDVIDLAKEMGVFEDLIISSFDEEVILKAKEYEPNCKTGLLYDIQSPNIEKILEDPIAYAKSYKADAIHPVLLLVSEDLVEDAHKNGLKVNVWTVNQEEVMKTFASWGVDGIITDVPDFAIEVLRK